MKFFVLCFCGLIACGGSQSFDVTERTLPEPLFYRELPSLPDNILDVSRVVLPVEECIVEGSDPPEKTSHGIYMSEGMAMNAARLRVAYDEMRELYKVDLQTMDRERVYYERYLDLAETEMKDLRERGKRSWWEKRGAQVMLGVGIALGVGMSVGIAAAISEVAK